MENLKLHKPGSGLYFSLSLILTLVVGCASQGQRLSSEQAAELDRDTTRLQIVDCLLPGQLRQLGARMSFLTPRRPIKTSASQCEIRGGEYVRYDRANFASSLKVWLPLAEEGDAEAQTYVGEIFEKGLGLEADPVLAADWYRRAADQGLSRAQINLGYLYESGLGVERDLVTAMNYYRQAAGYEEGSLEYVTALEVANREAQADELVDLRARQAELEARNAELEAQQANLAARQQEIAQLRAQIAEQQTAVLAANRAAPGAVPGSDAGSEAGQNSEQPLADALQQITALDQSLVESEARRSQLVEQLEQQQLETGQARERFKQTNEQLVELTRALDEREARVANLESELQARQAETGDAQAAQVAGLQQELEQQKAEMAQLNTQLTEARSTQTAEAREIEQALGTSEAEEIRLETALDDATVQIDGLRQAMTAQEQDYKLAIQALADELVRSQASGSEAEQQAKALQAQLETARGEQQRLTDTLLGTQLDQLAADQQASARLVQLESELARQLDTIELQQGKISTLQSNIAKTRASLQDVDMEKVAGVVDAGPSIEIIEPPVTVTRGAAALPVAGSPGPLDVVGRVGPSASLLSFKINGQSQSVNENGVFQYQVDSTQADSLQLVAIDQQGQRTDLDLAILGAMLSEQTEQPAPLAPDAPGDQVDFGNYHALIIGNNEYDHFHDLKTAGNDALAVEAMLRKRFGFKTELLLNANRYELLSALNRKRDELTDKDNLIIYYAGHGELSGGKGFWMPVDAEPTNTSNWVSNTAITDLVESMSARHVMIIADSCYSGSLSRSSLTRLATGISENQKQDWYRSMVGLKVRTVLTSGGVKPVLDSAGGAQHSLFAQALLEELDAASGIVETYELFLKVQQKVKRAASQLSLEQDPQYSPLRYAGHESGEFLFVVRDETATSARLGRGPDEDLLAQRQP